MHGAKRSTTTPTNIGEQTSPPLAPPPPPHQHEYDAPPVTVVLSVLLMVLFIVGFFSIYFCKCFMDNVLSAATNHQTSGTPVNPSAIEPPGLDPAIVNSFPTFPYNTVKEYRREKYGLECAICLCEFDDHDLLRLLTRCCHVFHRECIDLWLESHKSCPVCRRSLDHPESVTADKWPERENLPPAINSVHGTDGGGDDSFSVVMIKDNEGEVHGRVGRSGLEQQHPLDEEGKFSRSHSTGHSIMRTLAAAADPAVRGGGEEDAAAEVEDRYTLRLPEHVKEALTRRHQASLSCTTFVEFTKDASRKHCCFGEISGSCPQCGDVNRV